MKKYWLKSNICSEPLIWNWYAWTHLLAPTTAGPNLRKRYFKILQSFIDRPDQHVSASVDPKLRGGPYVNLPVTDTATIKELLNKTLTENQALLGLADAIDAVNLLLEKIANGLSLESAYQLIPGPLSGCIELVYDMHHHGSIRLIEPLIYSKYYDTKGQSIVLSVLNEDNRPFTLSTPRLPKLQDIHLEIPFASEKLDFLFNTRRTGCSLHEIKALLNLPAQDEEKFVSLFTEIEPIATHERYTNDGLRIRYFGHACVLLETKNTSILIDPFVG